MASSKHKQTPAEVVIELFGIRPLAAELQCSKSTIMRWRDSDAGLVPSQWHKPLLELARAQGLRLTAEDLVNGR